MRYQAAQTLSRSQSCTKPHVLLGFQRISGFWKECHICKGTRRASQTFINTLDSESLWLCWLVVFVTAPATGMHVLSDVFFGERKCERRFWSDCMHAVSVTDDAGSRTAWKSGRQKAQQSWMMCVRVCSRTTTSRELFHWWTRGDESLIMKRSLISCRLVGGYWRIPLPAPREKTSFLSYHGLQSEQNICISSSNQKPREKEKKEEGNEV